MAGKKTVKKKKTTMVKVGTGMQKKGKSSSIMQNPAKIGGLLFVLGVITAVCVGILTPTKGVPPPELVSLLILLGLLVGFFNITRTETSTFLLAGVSLVIVAALGGSMLGQVYLIGGLLSSMLFSILAFIIPAIIMVSLKTIWSLEKD